jgi:hypothetical protein
VNKTHAGEQNRDSFWQKRRAAELLRENLDGRVRPTNVARECSLFVCSPIEGGTCSQCCRAVSDPSHNHSPERSCP